MADACGRGDMMWTMRRVVIALAVFVASGAGCGPVAYINQVPRDAAQKVEQARALNAAKFSPYWWTRATEYLRMAREVASHADYQGANKFGKLSADAAAIAITESEERSKDPSKMPVNPNDAAPAPAKAIAPAKDE